MAAFDDQGNRAPVRRGDTPPSGLNSTLLFVILLGLALMLGLRAFSPSPNTTTTRAEQSGNTQTPSGSNAPAVDLLLNTKVNEPDPLE